ncbi:DUF6049 family protein [Actinomadura mexicana]|uniref:Uncharacterized protein n=1 Tax=Actinomadura mexicana TaxID=134959 RepID=A0A238W171_9ACTN|nr:DUF6049 family protein [Actinomadura mexicana]SNR39903.1 hypothetical protein SAMN06265355_102582 [Actinomadura mexicana]
MNAVGRALALAALLPCLAMAASPAMASPAGVRARTPAKAPAGAPAAAQARAQVALALTKVTPKTLTAKSKIEISGAARNRTGHPLAGLTLRLRYSAQPVTSRSQLDQLASGQQTALPNVAPQQQSLAQATRPGVTQGWSFRTTARQLGLRAPAATPGVYPMRVEVLNSAQQVVGGLTTFLTLMPKQRSFKPVAVGWVLPLIDRMHRANDRTFIDDELTKELSPGGRLHRLVEAAATTGTPVTWAIDPALLDDVQQMASGDYYVRPPGARKGVRKEKSKVAATWLASLKTASKGDPYFVLPYGDPDVTALVRRKATRDIGVAFDARNTGFVAQILGRQPDAHVAWPASGVGGPGTLEQLARYALKDGGSFLMSSSQFENPATGAQPNATTALQTHLGAKKALLYDQTVTQILDQGSRSASGALMSEQRFLAETAMIAAEAPSVQRTVVVAPDRLWDPASGLAKNLLTYTKAASWMNEVPLRSVESARPQARAFHGYSDDYEKFELGDVHLDQTRAIAKRAATFQAVMTGPVKISYERAVLRLESVGWRTSPSRAKRARKELEDELQADMHRVRVVPPKNRRVLMGGSSGKLPVLVENTLSDQSVKVRLVVTSENTAKLKLGELEPDDAVIELGPGERAQRWIPAQAAGNGNFGVRLDLQIPGAGGRTYGDGETITVTTTGYGRLALLITGGGLAVLFVGVGVRAIRARRRRKAEAAGDGSTGMGSAGTGEPGGGLPGPGIPSAEYSGAPGTGLPGAGRPPGVPAGPAAPGPPAPGTAPAEADAAGPAAGPSGARPEDPAAVPGPAADGPAAGRGEHRRRDGG